MLESLCTVLTWIYEYENAHAIQQEKKNPQRKGSYISHHLLQCITPQGWDQHKTLNWGGLETESKKWEKWKWKEYKPIQGIASHLFLWELPRAQFCSGPSKTQEWVSEFSVSGKKMFMHYILNSDSILSITFAGFHKHLNSKWALSVNK